MTSGHSASSRPQQGFTIVELMVALALGLIIATALVYVFIANNLSYRVQTGLARAQEGGRFAVDFLARDIRMAGFNGSCLSRGDLLKLKNTLNAGYASNFGTYVQGYDASAGSWSPALDAAISAHAPTTGSDILTLRLAGDGAPLTTPYMPTTAADLHVPAGNPFRQYDIAVICDGVNGAIFQITNANPATSGSLVHNTGTGSPGNATKDLDHKYAANAEVFRLSTRSYYVAPNTRGSTSLWMLTTPCPVGESCPVELVEGVERLQLEYGLDTVGDQQHSANRFATAGSVGNWGQVVSVRIGVLVRSADDGLRTTAAALSFNGTTTASDRRLRKTYTSVVHLRNRAP